MCLDTATYMNETLNTVPDDNFDADIDLGYEKNFYELRKCDNESLYIPIVPTLTEEFAIPILLMKNPPGVVEVMFVLMVLLLILIVSAYLWWRSWEKELLCR